MRSFFDYGVVMGGVGRIEDGQKPYVDFVTPIQTGWYVFNGLAEKIGGGTFLAMTWAGAVSCILATLLFYFILSRRWPWLPSLFVSAALVCATTSQHTLFWYNSWGVVMLAVMAWSGALAPVLRREDLVWHSLAGLALFLGGVTKINMQLVALMLGGAWAIRAGLSGRAGWGRVGATIVFYFVCAIVPVLAEMAWTGASFGEWWHNVVALPVASRSGMLRIAFSPDFLFMPLQDYYGPMALQHIGGIGAGLTAITVVAVLRKTWREPPRLERILPIVCGFVAFLGGAILLTTNMDIAYIGLAGWLALLVALWLGYELPPRGIWFYGGLFAPVMVIGAIAWQSAWIGQRSQFGHSGARRGNYVLGETIDADFAYLRGTKVPPEFASSLAAMAVWRRGLTAENRGKIFFGPGTEWAAHIWPALRTPGIPLYLQVGSSVGTEENARLLAAIRHGTFSNVTVSNILDLWDDNFKDQLNRRFSKFQFGRIFAVYRGSEYPGVSSMPVDFIMAFGGNIDSRFLVSSANFATLADGTKFLGVSEGQGEMRLISLTNRLEGKVVIRRVDPASRIPLSANFAIYAEDGPNRYERWTGEVNLTPGQLEAEMPYAIDSSHLPTLFTVEIPPVLAGRVIAGWRGPRTNDTGTDGPDQPRWFYPTKDTTVTLSEAMLARLLPGNWRPTQAFMKDGRLTASGIELSAGGEIWLKAEGYVTELKGTVKAAFPFMATRAPVVRSFWYRSCRIDADTGVPMRESDLAGEFRAWCAEPGGWLVLTVDPSPNVPPVIVHVDTVTNHP